MFQQEGYDLMAAAFEVYNEIGYGMAEEIYQQSLEIELCLRKIPFLTKQELEVYYKGHKLATCYKPCGFHSFSYLAKISAHECSWDKVSSHDENARTSYG